MLIIFENCYFIGQCLGVFGGGFTALTTSLGSGFVIVFVSLVWCFKWVRERELPKSWLSRLVLSVCQYMHDTRTCTSIFLRLRECFVVKPRPFFSLVSWPFWLKWPLRAVVVEALTCTLFSTSKFDSVWVVFSGCSKLYWGPVYARQCLHLECVAF